MIEFADAHLPVDAFWVDWSFGCEDNSRGLSKISIYLNKEPMYDLATQILHFNRDARKHHCFHTCLQKFLPLPAQIL